jgi:DNA-binding NarL/FixJ family response regulator
MKKGISDTLINILLIEDKPADILLIKMMLSTIVNFTIEQVARLSNGLECLEKGGIDVVIVDIVLPDSEGIEAIKKVYAAFPSIPIVVLTGFPDEEMGIRAIQEGAQDYLVKGRINADALTRILRYSIERKKTLEEMEQLRNVKSLEILSSGIAYELNNLFTVILDNITSAKMYVPSCEEAFSRLVNVENACKKAKKLNDRLLTLAKGGVPYREKQKGR